MSKNLSSATRLKRLLHAICLCFLLPTIAFGETTADESSPAPGKQIDLSKFGFRGLPPLERFTLRGNVTVHFLDREHLLITFDARKLIRRLPECTSGHQDRMIRAEVIDLRSETVTKQTEWYVHDKRRYLWQLASGRLLLRRLRSLYEIDSALNEKLLMDSPGELLWVDTTPDGKHIIVETALPTPAAEKSELAGRAEITQKRARVKIDYINAATLLVEHSLLASNSLELTTSSRGYGDSVRNWRGNVWLVRFGPDEQHRRAIARVRSPCTPDLTFPTDTTIFIGRCSNDSKAYSASIFSVFGYPLWRQRWSQLQHFPMVARSEDGSRFAIGTVTASRRPDIEAAPGGTSADPDEERPQWPDVEQEIRVFEAASGKVLLLTKAVSVVLNNPTFAVSPAGDRLAVLDGTTLNIFDLPATSSEERAKFLALAAGTPDLSAPVAPSPQSGSRTDASEEIEEEEAADRGAGLAVDNGAVLTCDTGQAKTATPPSASLIAKHTPEQERSGTTFKVGSNEVEVDVVVTDSRGHPVRGLSVVDFRVQENNATQKIRYFHEFAGNPQSAAVQARPAAKPANVFSNDLAPGPDRALVALVLDFVNTPIESQQYAKEELLKFLRKKPAGMQFALFVLGERLELLHGFTADENVLLASVSTKKSIGRFSRQLGATVDLSTLIAANKERAAIDFSNQTAVQHLEHLQASMRAGDLDRRIRLTVDAFSQLARYMAGIPGRKNIVWLSGSFPRGFFPNMGVSSDAPTTFSAEVRNYQEDLKRITNRLAEVHAAVYPVDVRGNLADSIYNAETGANPIATPAPGSQAQGPPGRAAPTPGAGTTTAMSIQAPSELQQQYTSGQDSRAAEQATMDEVAESTGGKAFYNTNGILKAVETAVEQASEYYMFSYAPENTKFDGAFRKIRVSLEKKGYHLAYRRGYFANPRGSGINAAEMAQELGRAAMQSGAPQAHELLFSARIVPLGKPVRRELEQDGQSATAGEKKPVEVQKYAIDYAVAGPQLGFTMNGEVRQMVLDFMASAFSDDGSNMARTAVQTTSNLKPEVYRDVLVGGLRMHQEVDVPVSASSLRLGVMDEIARYLGTLDVPLPIKAPAAEMASSTRKLPPIEPD